MVDLGDVGGRHARRRQAPRRSRQAVSPMSSCCTRSSSSSAKSSKPSPLSNKKLRRKRLCAKLNRAKVETSLAIRRIPFYDIAVEGVLQGNRARRRGARRTSKPNCRKLETRSSADRAEPRPRTEARNPQARSRGRRHRSPICGTP